ncbi:MAG: cell division protein ZapA [Gammaproteobacteria bacterium WSBS_2016_MAG_OTU1]
MPVLQIIIRQHKFDVSCDKKDEAAMRAAAATLEDKVKTLRHKGKVADGERATLMAALQIAFDAQKSSSAATSAISLSSAKTATSASADNDKITTLTARVNAALTRTESFLQKHALSGVNQ